VPKRKALKIRSAVAEDIPAMLTVERDSASAAHWRPEQYDKVFSQLSPRRLALVIEVEGTDGEAAVQGFLVARAVEREWEIENIVVAGRARRRGLGTRLLGEFIDRVRAEGAESVFLEVRESNRPARALYERRAFVESGRRKGYYANPTEDAVAYRLSFV